MLGESVSASLDGKTAVKLRVLAKQENRTVSNLVSNAVSLYTALPKELRQMWKQMHSSDDRSFQSFLREITALTVQRKFERARQELAETIPPSPEIADMSESELPDAAVGMTTKR